MSHEEGAEDLLIRARRNELCDSDERRLEVALGSSRELELMYRAGVEFDAAASLLAGDETRLDALVLGALARLDIDSAAPEPGARSSRPAARGAAQRRVAARYFAAGLACSLLLSVALASAWDYVEKRRELTALQQRAATLVVRPAARTATASSAPTTPPERAPAAPGSALIAAPEPLPAHSSPPRQPQAVDREGNRRLEEPNESELFTRANELRRQGNAEGAIALYRRLCDRYPNSAEAGDAKVLLGDLLLGQRASQAALEQFDSYGSGALGLEALWGKAQALRGLASPRERAVLERLVGDYPMSAYAGAARKRLRELPP